MKSTRKIFQLEWMTLSLSWCFGKRVYKSDSYNNKKKFEINDNNNNNNIK